jgi:hypothetical protein
MSLLEAFEVIASAIDTAHSEVNKHQARQYLSSLQDVLTYHEPVVSQPKNKKTVIVKKGSNGKVSKSSVEVLPEALEVEPPQVPVVEEPPTDETPQEEEFNPDNLTPIEPDSDEADKQQVLQALNILREIALKRTPNDTDVKDYLDMTESDLLQFLQLN